MTQGTSENHVVQHTQEIRGYFDARSNDYDAFYEPRSGFERWFNHVFRKGVYRRRDEVLNLAQKYNLRSVLDVGCGSGRNTVWWAKRGLGPLHGVDISKEMIEEAARVARQENVCDSCSFELADYINWDSDKKWDMVVACGVFDYVVDAEALLAHMAKHAKHVIYGSFPGWSLLRSPLRKIRYALRGCPTHFYRKSELQRIFANVGFGKVECIRVGGGFLMSAYRS